MSNSGDQEGIIPSDEYDEAQPEQPVPAQPVQAEETPPIVDFPGTEGEPDEEAPAPGYEPFDPSSLITKRSDLEVPGKEPLRNEAGDVLPEFDPRYRNDFEGLMFLGSLSHSFTWMHHDFKIRTLFTDELLAVGVLTLAYDQTLAGGLAYRTAIAALCLVEVDGETLPEPVERKSEDYAWANQKFNYVKGRWHQFVIDAVHNEYLTLEAKVLEVMEAMGKA